MTEIRPRREQAIALFTFDGERRWAEPRTIAVKVLGSRKDATHLRGTYDLTALIVTGDRWLEAFDGEDQTEIVARSTEIAATLDRPARIGQDPGEGR